MNAAYLVYALIAVGIFTVYMAVVHLLRRDRGKERVKEAATRYGLADEEAAPASASFCEGVLSVLGVDVHNQKETQLLLAQGGMRSPHAVTYFLFFKRIIQPVILMLGGLLFVVGLLFSAKFSGAAMAFFILVGGLMVVGGMVGANLWATNRKQNRQQKLLWSFPEVLDLLLVCIESGLGMDAALGKVCSEMKRAHPEATDELERTRMELTVLPDRAQALQNLAERTEIVPFKSLVAALIQTEKFGTSLLDTLRVLSEDQRVTRLFNAENRAARIPVLITIPLILCILPSFILIILGPPIIKVTAQGGIFGSATPN